MTNETRMTPEQIAAAQAEYRQGLLLLVSDKFDGEGEVSYTPAVGDPVNKDHFIFRCCDRSRRLLDSMAAAGLFTALDAAALIQRLTLLPSDNVFRSMHGNLLALQIFLDGGTPKERLLPTAALLRAMACALVLGERARRGELQLQHLPQQIAFVQVL